MIKLNLQQLKILYFKTIRVRHNLSEYDPDIFRRIYYSNVFVDLLSLMNTCFIFGVLFDALCYYCVSQYADDTTIYIQEQISSVRILRNFKYDKQMWK